MVAALKTGRNSIGIELDTEYCRMPPPASCTKTGHSSAAPTSKSACTLQQSHPRSGEELGGPAVLQENRAALSHSSKAKAGKAGGK